MLIRPCVHINFPAKNGAGYIQTIQWYKKIRLLILNLTIQVFCAVFTKSGNTAAPDMVPDTAQADTSDTQAYDETEDEEDQEIEARMAAYDATANRSEVSRVNNNNNQLRRRGGMGVTWF